MKYIIILFILFVFAPTSVFAAPFQVPNGLERRAEAGDAESQYRLGKLYYDHMVNKNYYKQADHWLSSASEQK